MALTTLAPASLATGIDATKLADGSVTSTELQYINTLSSNAQTQITAKAAVTAANTWTAGQRGEITALTFLLHLHTMPRLPIHLTIRQGRVVLSLSHRTAQVLGLPLGVQIGTSLVAQHLH